MAKFFIDLSTGNIYGQAKAGSPDDQLGRIPAWLTAIGIGPDATRPQEIIPNTVDASHEKHVPVIEAEKNSVTVKVGSAEHPMVPEHFIEWIYLETKHGGQRRRLNPGDRPEARFLLTEDDAPVAAYAYCNLHWLWKAEV